MKGFIIFKKQEPARGCYVYLKGETKQLAKGTTTQLAEDTARTVEKVEIRKAYKFGGEQVLFSQEEAAALRNFGDPVIRIIGFKPLEMLPIWANLKHSTFIYPSEEDFVGSTRVFSALQQKLLKDQKMAITWFIARRNAAPVLAALMPGAEKKDDMTGVQTIPPGLWILPLPFADDIRANPETTNVRAPDSLVDKMRPVIQQLQLPKEKYNPSRYPNPALQWHYRILQALALEEDIPEQPEDKTIPKYKQIDKRAGEYVMEWGAELEKQSRELASSSGVVLAKRPAPSKEAGAAKKAKADDNASELTESDMQKYFDKRTLGKLTVVQLKSWMTAKGLSTAGKKSDLVEAVEGYFESK